MGRLIDADVLDKHMELYAGTMIETYDARAMIDDAPTVIEVEDCISRKDVERLVYQYLRKGTDDNVAFYENFLDLPSVTPKIEPRKGHWKYDRAIVRCSNCGRGYKDAFGRTSAITYNYCPNCGAKMVEPQESEADKMDGGKTDGKLDQ